MNFNTASSSQAGYTQPFNSQMNLNNNKQTLVTANPTIFPSLNPLAGLYRNKPSSTPTTAVRRPSTSQEPIKKIKTGNNGREVVVMPVNNQEPVKMSKKEYMNNRITSNVSDDELFRVPQLPKRLRNQKQNKEQKQEQNEYVQRIQEFRSVGGSSLMMPELNLKPVQSQVPFVAKREQMITNNRCQLQQSRGVNPTPDAFLLNALYQRMNKQLYDFQVRQLMMARMLQMSQ